MPNDLQSLFDQNIGTFMDRLTAENYKPRTINACSLSTWCSIRQRRWRVLARHRSYSCAQTETRAVHIP